MTVDELAAELAISPSSALRLLEQGHIPSTVDPSGFRVASSSAVLAFKTQRESHRQSLAELAQQAQRDEGMFARQPPGVNGNLDDDDDDVRTPVA